MSTTPIDPEDFAQETLPTVVFERYMEKMPAASNAAGVPQFRERERVRMNFPGNVDTFYKTPDDFFSKPLYRQHFWEQYQAFKNSATGEQGVAGCPIGECPVIPRTVAEQFRYLKFQTVEQLIGADPGLVGRVVEGNRYQQAAKRWFEAARKTAETTEVIRERDQLRERVEYLESQLEAVNQHYLEITGQAPPKLDEQAQGAPLVKRRGRPRKTEAIAEAN